MEDDDEFGDLYSDVLTPLTTHSTPPPPPIQIHSTTTTTTTTTTTNTTTSSGRPFDLNINGHDDDILYNQSNFKISLLQTQNALPETSNILHENEDTKVRVLDSNHMSKAHDVKRFKDFNFMDESGIDIVVEERDDDNNTRIDGMEMEPMIPGLSMPRVLNRDVSGGGDDWDSDSDDDLQIVLNENTEIMGMERGGAGEDDNEDGDGDNLVIVAGNDPGHQQLEERDWGEEGERTEIGDSSGKVNVGTIVAPQLGYNSHGYQQPLHSQFKVSDNRTCGLLRYPLLHQNMKCKYSM